MTNPYESPQTPGTDRPASSPPFLTRQRVFWFGLGSIVAALMMVTASHALFVEWRGADDFSVTLVLIINCMAGLAFLAGLASLVVYHWFPDPRRKYPWRRKQPRGTVDTDFPTQREL